MPLRLRQFAKAKLAVEAFSILFGKGSVSCVDKICAKDNIFIIKMILNAEDKHRIIQS